MKRAYLAAAGVAGDPTALLEQLSGGLAGRIYDTGELHASGLDRDAVEAAADAAGLAPDTALCVGRSGALCVHAAVTATVAGTAELATVALGQANGDVAAAIAGATFASADYFRYSTAIPQWRVDGLLLAGYVLDEIDQYVRGAIERSLTRAELTVADVATIATSASEQVHAAAAAAFDGTACARFHTAADVVAELARPIELERPPLFVMLEDPASMTVCAFVLQAAAGAAP